MLELDFKNIKEPMFAEQAAEVIKEMVSYNMISEANRFAYNLRSALEKYPDFNRESPDLSRQYQKLINYAKFVTLVGLTEEEINDLFKNEFLTIFEILEINPLFDLIDKFRGFLVSLPIHQWRNDFKKELINKLLGNEEKLTKSPLKDPTGKELAPTVSNWLRDYQRVFGPNVRVDKVKQLEYLINSLNTKNLSAEEKERVKYLLNLYEFLKLDSMTLEGLEEAVVFECEEGQIKVLSHGILEEIIPVAGAVLVGARIRSVEGETAVEEPEIEGGIEEIAIRPKMGLEREEAVGPGPEREIKEKPKSPDLEIEEIDQEVKKIQKERPALKPETGPTIEQSIDDVIKSLELSFSDQTMERRFRNILQSYLKGVRGQVETLAVLKRPIEIGGMGFDEARADEIIWLLQDVQTKFAKQFREIKEAEKSEVKPGLSEGLVRPEDLVKQKDMVGKAELKPIDKEKFETGPMWQPPITVPPVSPKESIISPAEKEKMLKVLEGEEKELKSKFGEETGIPVRRPVGPEPRKRFLEDIKMKPKIYGPVDELKEIKLSEWRGWGSPQESIGRIEDKIEFLAEESLIKKAQGIKAWQSSEIYRLYLEIGEESLEKQQPVGEVIRLRERENRPTLTLQEFNKISELNQRLRF